MPRHEAVHPTNTLDGNGDGRRATSGPDDTVQAAELQLDLAKIDLIVATARRDLGIGYNFTTCTEEPSPEPASTSFGTC
ncbi:hypothetical protein MGN01_29330 [Methylobacterium gnaphalii]|uniref:Uncharacterized protein n=1 Tax=Methylobacterium gnaphalii TaxID=1010610 RepID=A0A512JMD2_9HYPH|nr:hypothetical protein MGN01_29330 [Methylobacterium gnaphalii]GLS50366.1 hypothetical protein GCM10007885_32180 [Methylobacterium gnaphalii]